MTTDFLPESVGGTEATTHELCRAVTSAGWSPAVLSGCRRRGRYCRADFWRRLLGRRLALDRDLGYPVYRARRPLRAIDDACSAVGPAVAVVQLGRLVPLASAFSERGVPTIVFLHNLALTQFGGRLFASPLLRYATVSRFMAEKVRQLTGLEAAVVEPLVDPAQYETLSTREVVTFVNPVSVKGLATALHLARARPDIPFEFVETWQAPERDTDTLRRTISALPNVKLLPRCSDMRAIYGRTRILLAPSQWEEPWGRVASEAQASSIPVLASRTGGLPEAVGPGGILVEPEAPPSAWESALAQLWDDPGAYARYSAEARAHARRAEFQPGAIVQKFCALLEEHGRVQGR